MAGIVLTIEVDDKGSVKVKQFSDKTKEAFDEMKKGPEQARAPMASIQESWVGLTAKVALATGAIYGVTRAMSSFVTEAAQAEEIENRLRFALETTGYVWKDVKSHVDRFANSLQDMTRFSDEQARQALTDMMMYTNDFAKAQAGAKLAMDMSVRTGMDLVTSARYIGMAMSGNVEMLGRYIPEFRNLNDVLGKNATMADKVAYAMKILNEKFGGTAQADLNSYNGIVAQFNNSWSDLKETLGTYLLPTLKEVFTWFKKLIDIANQWAGIKSEDVLPKLKFDLKEAERQISFYENYIKRAETAAPGMPYRLGPEAMEDAKKKLAELKEWADYLRGQIKSTQEDFATALVGKKDIAVPATKGKEEDLLAVYDALIQKANEWGEVVVARQELAERGWSKEKDIVEQAKEELARLERETNEWGEVAVARQELVEAGWKKQADEIKKQADEIQKINTSLAENISSAWSAGMVNIIKSTEDTSEKIKSFFQGIGDVFLSTVSKMITQWLLFGSITGKTEKGGGFLTGGSWGGILGGIASLFKYQEGGIVNRPTLGLVGEAGPEAVIPLKGGKVPVEGKAGGDTYIINNYNQVNDPNTFVRLYGPVVKKLSEQSAIEAKRFNKASAK